MLRLAIRVRREHAEVALAELLSLTPNGVEEVDIDADTVEYAVYGSPGELPELPDLQAALAPVGEGSGQVLIDVSSSEIEDDWADRWRGFHKPLVLGSRLTVRPPWEPAAQTDLDLVIDPGRAFGTGAHATTRLCLELLLDLADASEFRNGRVARISELDKATFISGGTVELPARWPAAVDLGCGSGVLGIAAVKLGFAPLLALDYDQLAVNATRENAVVNGVDAEELEVRRFDLREEALPPARLVLANLLGPLLLAWCARMTGTDHDSIIASGLLVSEADQISAAFAQRGYRESARRISGEWAALLLEAASCFG